jgi:hypothetical protein
MDGPVEDRVPVPQYPSADSRSAADEELHRRLAGYQLRDRLFREKYGMTLEEFEAVQVVKQHGYSFEIESDHQDWDQAVDGARSIERQLAPLRGEA